MRSNIRLLYLIPWQTDFAVSLVIFAVSRGMAEADKNLFQLGVMGAIFSLTMAGSSLVCGRLSDRFAPRILIAWGSFVLMTVPLLAGARYDRLSHAMLGIASGMIYPAVVVWLTQGRGVGPGRGNMNRVLMWFGLSWNLGVMAGQLGGGWLFGMNRHWPLTGAFVLSVANLCVMAAMCRHARPFNPDQIFPMGEQLHHRSLAAAYVRLAWIANLGGTFSMSMVFFLLPKLVVVMDVPSEEHGVIVATMRAIVIVVYVVMYRLKFWHFRFMTNLVSQTIAVAGLLILSMAHSTLMLWIGLIGLAQLSGFNYFASLYYSSSGSAEEKRGSASGIHEATLALGLAVGSFVGGLSGHLIGDRAPYVLAAAVVAILALVQLVLYLQQTRGRIRAAG